MVRESSICRTIVFSVGISISTVSVAVDFDSRTLADLTFAANTHDVTAQSMQLMVKPELSVYFDNGVKLTAIGRLLVESIDGMQPGDMDRSGFSEASKPYLLGETAELELREFYLEQSFGSDYLTLGKQQIVWGKADGLKVLDVVNPQSFRSFILDDFDDSRIPLWTVNYEWQASNDSTVQFLWIPDQTVHVLPERDARYAFTSPRFVPQAPPSVQVQLNGVEKPSKIIADSDFGLRWTAFLNGWDLTLNYLYHYDDLPVFYQHLSITPSGPVVTVDQKYERSHLLGGTFSNAFGNLTIRGELGYSTDKYFITTDSADTDGVARFEELSYVLGFDWFGFDESLISLQLFQSVVIDPDKKLTRPEVDTTLTFLAQKEFLNDTLKAEVLFIQNITDGDGLIRPKITYEWQDDLKTWFGLDIFHGDPQGLFGEFSANDRIAMGLELGF